MIVSVPEELDYDHMQVMNTAENNDFGPYVTVKDLNHVLQWDDERANRALDLLLSKGMCWLDNYGEKSFWFPRYVHVE